MILELKGVHKAVPVVETAHTGSDQLVVLDSISFSVSPSATVALVGPSGSGKTTLLGLCAGLDIATSGAVIFEGQNLAALSEDNRSLLRRRRMGFVFQNFQLLPNLTAAENVMLPLELEGYSASRARTQAIDALERVHLGARLNHYAAQLSGGEQQRVALARAIVHRPAILFADEPTGNLDAENAALVTELLFTLNRESQTALMLVTHNLDLAKKAGVQLALKGGHLQHA